MINITEQAANYIKSKSNEGLRLSVKSSGCNGYKYDWTLLEHNEEDDITFESFGAKVVVDKMSYVFVQDSTIDVNITTFSSSLVVNNPQVKHTCGCGESVSF